MIPITRKDHYLNEIVGWGDTAPEKPITTEEFFFAEILGEAVQAPEPLTRYQMYLAKIAGREIEIPYPKVRLEYFLAKAAGMDIETPTPITREEIFWSNYSAIVDFEVEGTPPLTYKAVAGTLKDYRIYGNTVDGESVGDLETAGEHAGEYKVPVTVEGKNLFDKNYFIQNNLFGQDSGRIVADPYTISTIIPCNPNTKYTISKIVTNRFIIWGCTDYPTRDEYCNGRITSDYDSSSLTFTTGNDDNYLLLMLFYRRQPTEPTIEDVKGSLMFNYGEALPYEPYQTPITTNLYLPEQIRKVGDEAEYIDYGEQKLHRIGAEDIDVTLPELPMLAGTNTLTVGTVVQPSKVYIKGEKERD